MQIWYPGPEVRHDGDYPVEFNPGSAADRPFAVITLSEDGFTRLIVQSAQEADRLIAAAVEAKRLLDPPDDAWRLTPKGIEAADAQAGPAPGAAAADAEPETVPWPTGLCGHAVTPGAWSQGFATCRECLSDRTPAGVALYDRATAGEQLSGGLLDGTGPLA